MNAATLTGGLHRDPLVEVYKIMEERLTPLKIPTDIRDTSERGGTQARRQDVR